MLPQLLTEISEDEAEKYITDDAYCAQEKLDGRNKALRCVNGEVTSANKKGQPVPTPAAVEVEAKIKPDFIAFAEHIGDVYHVHNLTRYKGEDISKEPYTHRLAKAIMLFPYTETAIRVVETAGTTGEKRKMFNRLKKENREGIVFKLKDAPHEVGYSEAQRKCKFWASLTAVVFKINQQSSIAIVLYDPKKKLWVDASNVTVLKRGLLETIKPGDRVEIKYLYALKSSGVLYQPSPCMTGDTFKRDDVDEMECRTSQLKFKPEEE